MNKDEALLQLIYCYGWNDFYKDLATFPLILKENRLVIKTKPNICGIYAWINKINGKMYIGKSKVIYSRVRHERRKFINNTSADLIKLFYAVRKYGLNNFIVVKLMDCTPKNLCALETLFITYYDTKNNGYNCTNGGDNPLYRKPTKKETIEKLTNIRRNYWSKKENRNKQSEIMKDWWNNSLTDEERKTITSNISDWRIDKEKVKHRDEKAKNTLNSKEVKNSISNSLKEYYKTHVHPQKGIKTNVPSPNRIKAIILDYNNKEYQIDGIGMFAEQHKICGSYINKILKGEIKHYKGWHLPGITINYKPKTYTLIDSNGELFEFSNIPKFCKEHNLTKHHIYDVISKKQNHHKGWHLPETNINNIKLKNNLYSNLYLKSPNNEIIKIDNVMQFCRTMNFSNGSFYSFIKHKNVGSSYNGWIIISK